jgi:hypothetical protein
MGLFRRKKAERVRGTAQVVSTTRPPHAATHGSLKMDIVVQAPGIAAYAHEYSKLVMSVAKWPGGGQTVPVTIDPDDHSDVEVLWDEVSTTSDRARDAAEQLAAMTRASGQSATAPGAPMDLAGLAALTGIPGLADVAGTSAPVDDAADPALAGAPASFDGPAITVIASQSSADPVERLTKLAALRDAGVVDAAQFEQLRQQILGQSNLD